MRISKVYTRTGDDGDTGLVGGGRVPKNHPRVEAYGTVDELSSTIGLARAELQRAADFVAADAGLLDQHLDYIQHRLFDLGAVLATRSEDLVEGMPTLDQASIDYLEALIDAYNADLPPLKDFVLPGGNAAVSALHVARCVARRAERCTLTLHQSEPLENFEIAYLNRLSDLLFVLSRWAAKATACREYLWQHDLEAPPLPTSGSTDVP